MLWGTVKVLESALEAQSTDHFLISPHKILRQFEALMGGGGSSHAQRAEAENHQPPPLASTDSPAQCRQSRPVDHVTAAERDSHGEPADDGHPHKELSQNQSRQSGAAGVQTDHESADANADGTASPPTERELQLPCVSKLSLFSGMQLVTKSGAQCHRGEQDMAVGGDGNDDKSPADQQPSAQASSAPSSAPAESSQPPSAFSFLNL